MKFDENITISSDMMVKIVWIMYNFMIMKVYLVQAHSKVRYLEDYSGKLHV